MIRPLVIARRTGLTFSSQFAVWTVERIFDISAVTVIVAADLLFSGTLKTFTDKQYDIMRALGAVLIFIVCALLTFAFSVWRKGEQLAQWVERKLNRVEAGAVCVGARGVDALTLGETADTFFRADVGISGVAHAIAETGTLVMASRPHDPRSLTLLPPVHIAVVDRHQLLGDLFDLFAQFEAGQSPLPSCLTLITGPSKTGDIELKLVTGVHGPGELHVVVISNHRDRGERRT